MEYRALAQLDGMQRHVQVNRKVLVNLAQTKYSLVRQVCEEIFLYQTTSSSSKTSPMTNLLWNDHYITEDDLRRLQPY